MRRSIDKLEEESMENEKQHSLWKVSTNRIAERTLYQVYRNIDINEVDHSGNRETRGGLYDSRHDAEALARRLNSEEAVK